MSDGSRLTSPKNDPIVLLGLYSHPIFFVLSLDILVASIRWSRDQADQCMAGDIIDRAVGNLQGLCMLVQVLTCLTYMLTQARRNFLHSNANTK